MFARHEDTIVAISSPPEAGVRGIVRLSGPDALRIAAEMFARAPDDLRGFRRYSGCVRWPDEAVDVPAELYVFREPRSYTRQDVAEIHTIGSMPLLAGLVDAAQVRGARLAEPGEFTGRAFLAGALDLTAVEGVAAMVYASSDAQHQAAEQLLHGALARQARGLHERIVDLLALVEASIDFVEEPIDFLSPEHARAEAGDIAAELGALVARSLPMERLDVRRRVVLLGPPNAGKSTLFNRLTGLDRSICSAIPGTTRDLITAPVGVGRTEVWLVDAAGVGDARDAIEHEAAARAREAAGAADAVLLVLDAGGPAVCEPSVLFEGLCRDRILCVWNKTDRLGLAARVRARHRASELGVPFVFVSADRGDGIDDLKAALAARFDDAPADVDTTQITMNARHRHALDEAAIACRRAVRVLDDADRVANAADVLALELREAADQLAAIVGAITSEDVLGRIFRRFCIGK